MLQVISGKFFKKPNRFTHDAKAVTYSNFSYYQSIKTCIATLEPADIFHESAVPYIINYTNQIEYDEIRPGVISRIGDPEIVQQFQLLCIFGLRAFFHTDKQNVEINCRERRKNSGDHYLNPVQVETYSFFYSKTQVFKMDRVYHLNLSSGSLTLAYVAMKLI
jgi:hypothetical protein